MSTETIPVLLGFILLLAILIPSILLWITYRKYKRIEKALPDAQAIEKTEARIIEQRQSALTQRLLEDWKTVAEDEVELARHTLWTAMLLEAASDGSIDHREMKFVSELFGRMGGQQVDFRPVINAAELVHKDRRSALSEVAKAKRLGAVAKQQVLAGAFLVSVCDHSLSDHELACIMDIANALGISQRDRKIMLGEIRARFEG
ncbi:MAG: TerB family tellurite resistance protein [Pseudomonadota bacterium]|nr:TerB family tellurite resistance protein [Pseudomonadota bacterium]